MPAKLCIFLTSIFSLFAQTDRHIETARQMLLKVHALANTTDVQVYNNNTACRNGATCVHLVCHVAMHVRPPHLAQISGRCLSHISLPLVYYPLVLTLRHSGGVQDTICCLSHSEKFPFHFIR